MVISDLHLSEGRDPVTGRVFRNEDFFFDDDFREFLHYHAHSQGKWRLIINGDFIDFLQVTSVPTNSSMKLSVDPVYGLKAGAEESVWKLKRVFQGHQEVFQSLAEFATENQIVVISGNHDIEFYYPQVQQAFRRELGVRVPKEQRQRVERNILFLPWFYFDGTLYVEHGHQYDPLNSFTHVLDPRLPESSGMDPSEADHIDLPLGSLFVRYLFNRVEVATPFADNIKPATRFVSWFMTHHPLHALNFLLTDGREMFRRVKTKWKWVPDSAFALRRVSHREKLERLAACIAEDEGTPVANWAERLTRLNQLRFGSLMRNPIPWKWKVLRLLIGPLRTPGIFLLFLLVAAAGILLILTPLLEQTIPSLLVSYLHWFRGLLGHWGQMIGETIRWLFLLELILAVSWCLYRRRAGGARAVSPNLRERANRIHRLLGVKYVVMGHTHEADLYDSGPAYHYFNTGTWTKVFGEEEIVLREENEFTFVRVTGAGKDRQARLMKWDGRARSARLAYLFAQSSIQENSAGTRCGNSDL